MSHETGAMTKWSIFFALEVMVCYPGPRHPLNSVEILTVVIKKSTNKFKFTIYDVSSFLRSGLD